MDRKYSTFSEFYPFYLTEHSDPTCRMLHYIGTWLVLVVLVASLATNWWWGMLLIPMIGYGFAWVGHFFFEKNRPATFTYPLYSLMGDWVMWKDILTGRVRL